MESAWADLFSGESETPIARIECEESVEEKQFLPELVKGLSLLAAWYNRRFDLDEKTQMDPTDFEMVSYDNSYGDWSLTALHKDIPDHYFIVEYEAEASMTTLTQFRLVERESISDSELAQDEEEIDSLVEKGQAINVIDITERRKNGQ